MLRFLASSSKMVFAIEKLFSNRVQGAAQDDNGRAGGTVSDVPL